MLLSLLLIIVKIVFNVYSPSPNHNRKVDLEHPRHERTYVEKKLKGKEVALVSIHLESLVIQPAIIYGDLFPNSFSHSVQFVYRWF